MSADGGAQMENKRRVVPIEEAITRIGEGDYVHTFRGAPFGLLGADWGRKELIDAMRKGVVVEAGPQACAMGHTLAIENQGGSPLFIEAKPQPVEAAPL
jgi:hypothetical protein